MGDVVSVTVDRPESFVFEFENARDWLTISLSALLFA
jgi:hypothetical protein